MTTIANENTGTAQALDDLDLMREYVDLLQVDGGRFTLGNDERFLNLAQHPKAKEAFVIAWSAGMQEELPLQIVDLIFTLFAGVRFYKDTIGRLNARLDADAPTL